MLRPVFRQYWLKPSFRRRLAYRPITVPVLWCAHTTIRRSTHTGSSPIEGGSAEGSPVLFGQRQAFRVVWFLEG
jgi:hypothetical protein